MGQTLHGDSGAVQFQMVGDLLVRQVQHDNRDLPIGIQERCRLQRVVAGGAQHAARARLDKPRKMADVIVGTLVVQVAGLRVGDDRRAAKVSGSFGESVQLRLNLTRCVPLSAPARRQGVR